MSCGVPHAWMPWRYAVRVAELLPLWQAMLYRATPVSLDFELNYGLGILSSLPVPGTPGFVRLCRELEDYLEGADLADVRFHQGGPRAADDFLEMRFYRRQMELHVTHESLRHVHSALEVAVPDEPTDILDGAVRALFQSATANELPGFAVVRYTSRLALGKADARRFCKQVRPSLVPESLSIEQLSLTSNARSDDEGTLTFSFGPHPIGEFTVAWEAWVDLNAGDRPSRLLSETLTRRRRALHLLNLQPDGDEPFVCWHIDSEQATVGETPS